MLTSSIPFKRALLVPCAALVAVSFHISDLQAKDQGSRKHRPQLTETQKQQLFETRRSWELRSFNRKNAIRNKAYQCVQAAQNPAEYKTCKTNQRKSMGVVHEEGRAAINATLKKLGLPLLPEQRGMRGRPHH